MRFLRVIAPLTFLSLLVACVPAPSDFTLSSPDFEAGGPIPSSFTCDGEGQRPALEIANVPADTVSLALLLEDPDTASGLFTHWTVWNIDPRTTTISGTDPLVGAIEGQNGRGTFGYIGPCPPTGTHRYIFRLFAMNRELELPSTTTPEDLKRDLQDYVIAQTELTGLYTRTGSGSSSSETGTGTKTLPGSTVIP